MKNGNVTFLDENVLTYIYEIPKDVGILVNEENIAKEAGILQGYIKQALEKQ
ncbi:MAG: hypothetical protein LBM93_06210 [Oscillospiraceae bacterium]|nr:hypothetical protein [Oscillospiraceae bacterium]